MRAAVTEAKQSAGVGQHFAHRLVIAVGVVDDREEQEIVELLGQVVIGDLLWARIALRSDRGDALLARGLVIGRRAAHYEHLVPAADHVLPRLRQPCELALGRLLGEKLGA